MENKIEEPKNWGFVYDKCIHDGHVFKYDIRTRKTSCINCRNFYEELETQYKVTYHDKNKKWGVVSYLINRSDIAQDIQKYLWHDEVKIEQVKKQYILD